LTLVATCHNDIVMTAALMMRAATRSAFVLAVAAGCSEVVDFGPFGSGENIPTVGDNPGHFVFGVTARNWTFDKTYAADNLYSPNPDHGTLDIGMAITYSGGDGLVTITDVANAVVFNQTLAGNVANGTIITVSGKPPFQVRILANNYTGVVILDVIATSGGM
jgi:hypothetical protein